MVTIYQNRYRAHQERKKRVLLEIIKARHSDRVFADRELDEKTLGDLLVATNFCPSSCDRGAIYRRPVANRDRKELLGGLLVGGVGWIHRAPLVFLLFADPVAYKAEGEIAYMPYLDAGVVIQQLYLTATAMGLACCYCNPNIRPMNQEHFKKLFGTDIFCGAFAVGYKMEG